MVYPIVFLRFGPFGMFLNSSRIKLVFLFVMAILLSDCTNAVDNRASENKPTTPFTLPVAAYLAMAKNQPDNEKQALLIMAAGRALSEGHSEEAAHILSQTSDSRSILGDEKNVLLAKISVVNSQWQQAISHLSQVNLENNLPNFYRAEYHNIRALSWEALGNTTDSINERITLGRLLTDEKSLEANRRSLWFTLNKLPVAELDALAAEARDGSELQGWMTLALIPRDHAGTDQTLVEKVEGWQQRYPTHPANSLLPSSLAAIKKSWHGGTPAQMALLLPLSGMLAGPGGAVRDGFMAAWHENAPPTGTNVRLYDTASADVASLYQKAIAEGAEYVVGPLTKNDVAKISSIDHPVPTLVLNDMGTDNSNNVFRFGLSPADEAKQIATKAFQNGLKRALIIAPSGVWGDEIVNAFSKQWQSMGGEVVEKLGINDNDDLNKSVRTFLHVTEREANEKQFREVAGKTVSMAAKRRQDFDMIFLLAYPSRARQLMPLLKYYFAGDVPVYATSSVYSGTANKMGDRDLDGIIFCDMPWVFNHQLANKNWPEQFNSYTRLYALGMDSYILATQLNQLLLFPGLGVQNKSGVLYLNQAQQVSRLPAFGKFRQGLAEQMSI